MLVLHYRNLDPGQDCGSAAQASQSVAAVAPMAVKKVELSEGSEHTVKMLNSGEGGQMIFEPAVLKVSVGDTIHFKASDMSHNSASVDGMLPDGAESRLCSIWQHSIYACRIMRHV